MKKGDRVVPADRTRPWGTIKDVYKIGEVEYHSVEWYTQDGLTLYLSGPYHESDLRTISQDEFDRLQLFIDHETIPVDPVPQEAEPVGPILSTKKDGPCDYVLGFAFNLDMTKVVLIEKKRPSYLNSKLNGVGGKVEDVDGPGGWARFVAMAREYREETGVQTFPGEWKLTCVFTTVGGSSIYIFSHFSDIHLGAKTVTDENIGLYEVSAVLHPFSGSKVMPNIGWMIAQALSFRNGEKANHFVVSEVP